jgi:hypothetical protein
LAESNPSDENSGCRRRSAVHDKRRVGPARAEMKGTFFLYFNAVATPVVAIAFAKRWLRRRKTSFRQESVVRDQERSGPDTVIGFLLPFLGGKRPPVR